MFFDALRVQFSPQPPTKLNLKLLRLYLVGFAYDRYDVKLEVSNHVGLSECRYVYYNESITSYRRYKINTVESR